jgi:hypothetical protein
MKLTSQSPSVELRQLTGQRSEVQALQEVIEAAPDYMYRITGLPPGNAEGQRTFLGLPEGKSYEDKFVYGIFWGEHMVGCADIIRAHPKNECAWPGIQSVRLSVIRTNEQVLPFWKKMGFVETGEVKPYRYAQLTSEVIILEKRL